VAEYIALTRPVQAGMLERVARSRVAHLLRPCIEAITA
jgi:hypothetical protein